MSRTILYPDLDDSQARVVEQPKFGGPASAQAQRKNRKDEKAADGYAEKLVKYIPAEVVAFFAPLATLAQDRSGLLIALALVGLIATPAYLWQSSRRLPPKKQPLVHTYVLACCAFVAWAVGTSKIGALAGIDATSSAVIMGVAVFAIPLIDGVAVDLRRKYKKRGK